MTAIQDKDNSEDMSKLTPITDEERQAIKARLKARTIAWRHMPVFRLNNFGKRADIKLPKESRLPLSFETIRQFILNLTLDNYVGLPNWCHITKKNNASHHIVLAIDDISIADLQENPDLMPEANKLFKDGVEMTCAWAEGVGLSQALAFVPVPTQLRRRIKAGIGSFRRAIKEGYIQGIVELSDFDKNNSSPQTSTVPNLIKAEKQNDDSSRETNNILFKSEETTTTSVNQSQNDKSCSEDFKKDIKRLSETASVQQTKVRGCSKLQLLLSPAQLVAEGYPLPGYGEEGFKFTKDVYSPVKDDSRMFSVDCEWCLCIDGSSGLSRVAIVDDKLETVYHTFVKPKLPILDYLTRYSGITERDLRYVTKTLESVQEDIRELLPSDAILVGQSLNSDLKALRLYHPYVIDTSVIYNLTGRRSLKTKLQLLADAFTGKRIQTSVKGHNPEEDAIAAMELVLLKIRMGIEYGDIILSGHTNWKVFPQEQIRKILLEQESEDIAEAEEEDETEQEDDGAEKEYELGEEETQTAAKRKRETDSAQVSERVRRTDEYSRFFMKYCLMLQIHDISATLITTDRITADTYKPSVTQPDQRVTRKKLSRIEKPLADPVQITVVNDVDQVVSQVDDALKSKKNNITLIHTSAKEFENKNRSGQLKKLDCFISKIYSCLPLKGVFTVILGGKRNPKENGACLVKIHKPYIT